MSRLRKHLPIILLATLTPLWLFILFFWRRELAEPLAIWIGLYLFLMLSCIACIAWAISSPPKREPDHPFASASTAPSNERNYPRILPFRPDDPTEDP
jgi:hypothetical protein